MKAKSKLLLLTTLFIAFSLGVTVVAVTAYDIYSQDSTNVSIKITYGGTVNATNAITLPDTAQNIPNYKTTVYALNVTTLLPNLKLRLSTPNSALMSTYFSYLRMVLRVHGTATNATTLDLLSASEVVVGLATPATYYYDYIIEWNLMVPGTGATLGFAIDAKLTN